MFDLFQRLTDRERIAVTAAAVVVISGLVFSMFVSPIWEKKVRLENVAQKKGLELVKFRERAIHYGELEKSVADLEKRLSGRKQGFSILGTLESVARQAGVQDRIASMKPVKGKQDPGLEETSVEVRLEKLDLARTVEFLKRIEETRDFVIVKRLRMKSRFDDPQLLDVTVLASTLEAK